MNQCTYVQNQYDKRTKEVNGKEKQSKYWNNHHFDGVPKIISHFWGTNNIFVDCTVKEIQKILFDNIFELRLIRVQTKEIVQQRNIKKYKDKKYKIG